MWNKVKSLFLGVMVLGVLINSIQASIWIRIHIHKYYNYLIEQEKIEQEKIEKKEIEKKE